MTGVGVESFNPDRLDLARRLRGVTRRSLARDVGLSAKSLTRYLTDDREPDAETVSRFAKSLGFPTRFFYGPLTDPIPEAAPSFRARSVMTRRQRDQAVAEGILGMCLSDWIDRRFNVPPVSVECYEDIDPDAAAMTVRGQWGLGQHPIKNMVHLIESHGIRVFALSEHTKVVDAYSFWSPSMKPFIFLNTTKAAERSRMDAAHELGHLVMHRWGTTQRSRAAEEDAKRFAAAFLMPAESVVARLRRNPALQQIIEAKAHWKVSVASLAYRLRQLNMMSEYQYTRTFVEIGSLGYRTQEPKSIDRETSLLLGQVFDNLRERKISISSVAHDLAVYPQDLSQLLRRLVRSPLPV